MPTENENIKERIYGRSIKKYRIKSNYKLTRKIKNRLKQILRKRAKRIAKRELLKQQEKAKRKAKKLAKKLKEERKKKLVHKIDNSKQYVIGIDNGEKGAWAILSDNKIIDVCEFPESFNEYADFITVTNAELRQVGKNKEIPSSETKNKEMTKRITLQTSLRNKHRKSSEEFRILNEEVLELRELRNLFNKRKRLRARKKSLDIKRQYYCDKLYSFLKKYSDNIKYAIIEQPIRQSVMGITADVLIKSGEIYGINTCILQLHGIKLFQVSPKQWQRQYDYVMPKREVGDAQYLQKRRKAFKEQSIQFCKDIFVNADNFIKGDKETDNDNIAEACLIGRCKIDNLEEEEDNEQE